MWYSIYRKRGKENEKITGMTIKQLYDWAVKRNCENSELVLDYCEEYDWVIDEVELSIRDKEVVVTMNYFEED